LSRAAELAHDIRERVRRLRAIIARSNAAPEQHTGGGAQQNDGVEAWIELALARHCARDE
jgi:hypothetical protein